MIRVENNNVTMFGSLDKLTEELAFLLAAHYRSMKQNCGEEEANSILAAMGKYAVSPDAMNHVSNYKEGTIPVDKK